MQVRPAFLHTSPPSPLALPTTSIFHSTWSRPTGKLLAPPCPTAQEGGRKMEGGHRPEGQKCPQLRALFSFLQAWYTFAVYLWQSIICTSVWKAACSWEQRRAVLAQLLVTSNRLALLSGALPSGLALEELPAPPRELDLFHITRLTQKEQSCSQHLLILSQLWRPRVERVIADHGQWTEKEEKSQQPLVQHLPRCPFIGEDQCRTDHVYLWVESWETAKWLKGQQMGWDRGILKSKPRKSLLLCWS